MNGIGRVEFDFTAYREPFIRQLYAGWDHFFQVAFQQVADEVFQQFDRAGSHVVIPEMILELGEIPEAEFYDRFPAKLREAMRSELVRLLNASGAACGVGQMSGAQQALQALCGFLLRGVMPWEALHTWGSLDALFRSVVQQAGAEFRAFLYTHAHYTSLRRRLVMQFRDPELERGVLLLSPSEGGFICAYIRILRQRFEQRPEPELSPAVCREAVWEVVYTFLTDRRGSYFNRKSFVEGTLHGLSARLRTSYGQLLKMVAAGLPRFTAEHRSWPELLMILNELQASQTDKEAAHTERLPEWRELYRILAVRLHTDPARQGERSRREMLISVLSAETSCRAFIREMDEQTVIRMVPIVAPQQSTFVVDYARSLDRSKAKGAFEGRAGSEFTLLKWTLIFPVLLDRSGTTFSRSRFLLEVLSRIAAHYNLDRAELLVYFAVREDMPPELALLFRELTQAVHPEKKASADSASEQIDRWTACVTEGTHLPDATIAELIQLLETTRFMRKLILKIGAEGCHRMIALLFPSESPFIAEYAGHLERSANRGLPEGRACGDFRTLKWEFILAVLVRQPGTTFERRAFVAGVLRRIAAHYNLDYTELLFYFHRESGIEHLPCGLGDILSSLAEEEKQVFLRNALHCNDAGCFKLAAQLAPAGLELIRSLISLLERFRDIWTGSRDSTAFRNLLWRLVLGALLDGETDMNRFAEIILERLSEACRKEKAQALRDFITRLDAEPTSAATKALRHLLQRFGSSGSERRKHTPAPRTLPAVVASKTDDKFRESASESEPIYIHNAGLALLTPYLPHLFDRLGLTENGAFIGTETRMRSVFLMQYAVWGRTEFPEYEMALNKLLAGWPSGDPLPAAMELTELERSTVASMLEGVTGNWPRLKNTSAEGLREGFLQRSGALRAAADRFTLRVESKAYDMLLDSLPWSYSPIRFRWMERPVIVEWR